MGAESEAGPFVPSVGAVFSADIAVPEHEREVRFYSRVLGTGERPLWRDDLMNRLGMPVIGLGERGAEHSELPLQWMPHIQVVDVAASADGAEALGGRVLMRDRDGDGVSQWAVLLDPDGAAFGIIPVVHREPMDGAAAAGDGRAAEAAEPPAHAPAGRIAWLDLTVADAPAARDFYREVIGWDVNPVSMTDGADRYDDYAMLTGGGRPSAGVCHARGVNATLPPVWLIYLPVGDLGESLRRVRELGGDVLVERGGEAGSAYAVIRDPVGAHLALVPA